MAATSKEEAIVNFINAIKEEVTGLIAVSIVDISSGMSLGSYSSQKTFNPDIASAYNVEVVKQKMKAINALKISQPIDDILVTLKDQIHILKVIGSQKYLVYLAADSSKANLGYVRSLLRTSTEEVDKFL